MPFRGLVLFGVLLFAGVLGFAGTFGTVRGMVHDPQHHPIPGAEVTLRGRASDWTRTIVTDSDGEFQWMGVPAGLYALTVVHPGFRLADVQISVQSDSAPVLHIPLSLAELRQSVEVSAAPELVNPGSSTTESTIDRSQIEQLPGADRTNSLAMITDVVPGASIVHDQLHIRGGHQVTWLVDGVPVPNTNIASNVGPQFDPKDIDYLEVQRGGYSAEYGDRAFGVFNVVPRSGFERNDEAELVTEFGSNHETNDQLSVGGHSQRFAYYGSLTGNRTDLGLQTPGTQIIHDMAAGLSGFASLIYNRTPMDQLRLITSVRGDHYQVPNSPEEQSLGIRDTQNERDAFVNFSWVRTVGQGKMLTVSPFYHRNRASYEGGPGDTPQIPSDDRTSSYAGGQVNLSIVSNRHNLHAGLSVSGQREDQTLGLQSLVPSGLEILHQERTSGNIEAGFVEDQFRVGKWLTLNGGVRLTHFSGLLTEKAASPRAGATLRLPGLHWVLRGFYGRYYQPPPLSTISGPLLDLAAEEGFGFLPLRGERDEQKEVGLAIPIKGWAIDLTHYHTNARNFFDHDVLGNSNIFFPLTIAEAHLRGFEATLQSAKILGLSHVHIAYSRQFAEGQGGITGGLTSFNPPEGGRFFLDHDQRHTLAAGFECELPWKSWVSGNLSYGSGFLNADGPQHLPGHTTFDLSFGKSFGENLSLRLSGINLANSRYMLDNSNTFGGTHFNYPRELSISLRWRIRY